MNQTHPVHTTGGFSEPGSHFEINPFTKDTGCPVSDVSEAHLHDYYVIQFVTEGQGSHVIDFQPFNVTPNTFYFVSPQQLHFWSPDGEMDGYVIAFTEEFLQTPESPFGTVFELDFFNTLSNSPVMALEPEQTAPLKKVMDDINTEFWAKNTGYISMIRAYFHVLMVQLKRIHSEVFIQPEIPKEPSLVRRFKQLVAETCIQQRSIQEYAKELGVSVSSLNSAIKGVTSQTPGQIVRNELVTAAKRLLAHSDMSVSEVCYELRFEDPSYFGRFFKRETGFTPSAFREDITQKYHHFVR